MKIFKHIQDKKEAFLDLMAEDIDDIYEAYRIIEAGDHVKTITSRSIQLDNQKTKNRISLVLEVEAIEVTVDLTAGILFVKGKILNETKYTKLGSFHVLEVPVHQRFSIKKDSISLGAIEMLKNLNISHKAETAYLLCRSISYSLVLSSVYLSKQVLTSKRDKNKKTQEKTLESISNKIPEGIKTLIVIGDDKNIAEALKRNPKLTKITFFINHTINTPSTLAGDKQIIFQLMSNPSILEKINSFKYNKEIYLINSLGLRHLNHQGKVCIGKKEAFYAAENYLLSTLILVDNYLKSAVPEERKEANELIELAKKCNAEIFIISEHTFHGQWVEWYAKGVLGSTTIDLPKDSSGNLL
ncbi:protein pelota [Nematocida sp. AWRm80]|nr:protein pelota [Nematocida sp. AWRm80]